MYISEFNEFLEDLAGNAARSIENLILGRKTSEEEKEVEKLQEYLEKKAIDIRDNARDLDSRLIPLLWQTLSQYNYPENSDINTTSELAPKIHLVSLELRNYKSFSKGKLEELRKFCINLSKEATRYESPVTHKKLA
jgi:uncharacterized protein YecE (DUF72 family)